MIWLVAIARKNITNGDRMKKFRGSLFRFWAGLIEIKVGDFDVGEPAPTIRFIITSTG
ncbi:MAG TPA: hypothetical protein V6D15_24705 [Oculatellaceae cyanobacterium]